MGAKVAYNACYGGFSLSRKAGQWLADRGLEDAKEFMEDQQLARFDYRPINIPRHHRLLIECIEAMGQEANGKCAKLRIAEVSGPYRIDEYDGYESVETPNSYEWINPGEE